MSEWYSRLVGDTAEFALRISLSSDPDARPSESEATSSWGSLEIWARGRCLTRSRHADGAYRDDVQWFLLPLLEWWAENLPYLANEETFPLAVSRDDVRHAADWIDASEDPLVGLTESEEDDWFERRSDYKCRHGLRFGALDAALPMLLVRRLGSFIELSWDNGSWGTSRRGLEFTEVEGSCLVSASRFSKTAATAIVETCRVLEERGAVDAKRVRAKLDNTRPRWKLLLPPQLRSAVGAIKSIRERIEEAQPPRGLLAVHTPETLALRGLRGASPALLERVAAVASPEPGSWPRLLEELRTPSLPTSRAPWQQGYEAATRVRDTLGWSDEPVETQVGDLHRWLTDNVGVATAEVDFGNQLDLLTVGIENTTPKILGGTHKRGSAMASASGLGHLLMDMEPVSFEGPTEHWPTAARARAFAAMLLMPEDGVRSVLRQEGGATAEGVRSVMKKYNTSALSTTWHLRNLGIIGDHRRAELLQQVVA